MSEVWPLIGHHEAEAAFMAEMKSRRLHHAWLLQGPSGIGKSILALRLAARLLGARPRDESEREFSSEDPVVQKILAAGHPDFRYVRRRPDENGKLKQDIPISEIRALSSFFALRPALGGWRVGVIDSLDELNRNGLNALLKTLEEPPASCMLILIDHGSQPVLPTIRSRCRTLRLAALSRDESIEAIGETKNIGPLLEITGGRPGKALALHEPAARKAIDSGLALFDRPKDADSAALFIQTASESDTALEAASLALLNRLEQSAISHRPHAELWLQASAQLARAAELNMDRTQTAAKLAQLIQSAK